MLETLTSVDLQTYTTGILYWGLLGIVSAIAIHFTRMMPISSRVENNPMGFMGNINKRAGWIIMETPILMVVTFFYVIGDQPLNPSIVLLSAFVFHYFHRALIFPYRIKVQGKTMPVSSMLSSMIFYIVNGYLIGYYFGFLKIYPSDWYSDPRFIIGMSLFITGFIINVTADNILINLRKPGETGYKIPHGGLYRYISCPNYFGEIIEWIGFAIMCWCLPATVYAAWVALPLLAQGINAHRWYREKFADQYPAQRKAIIPFVV